MTMYTSSAHVQLPSENTLTHTLQHHKIIINWTQDSLSWLELPILYHWATYNNQTTTTLQNLLHIILHRSTVLEHFIPVTHSVCMNNYQNSVCYPSRSMLSSILPCNGQLWQDLRRKHSTWGDYTPDCFMSELLYVMHDVQMAICTMHVYHSLSHSFAIQVTVYSDEADGRPLGLSQDPARTLIWVFWMILLPLENWYWSRG